MKRIKPYLVMFMMYALTMPVVVHADLHYVGCGTAEGIPQPLVQITRMIYTFLVVITPIILIGTSVYTMVMAIKGDDSEEVIKAKNKLVKKFIAAGVILLIGIITRFALAQFSTNNGDRNSAVSCLKCFLYNADCHASDSGNDVKRSFYYEEDDSDFINDTERNRSNYKPPSRNSSSNPGTTITSSSNVTSNTSSNTTSNTNNDLTKEIQDYINSNSAGGKWAVYVKGMSEDDTVAINANDSMISASVIKLFVMATAYKQISDGTISDSQTLQSNINQMITVSSNEATNNVINAINGKMTGVNNYNNNNGYSATSLNRYLGGDRTPENMTSAADVGSLLEKIYKGSIPKSTEMANLLKAQTRRGKIPAGIPSGITVGNKTGELSDVENDAAIVWANGDYIIVVLSNNVSDTGKAQSTIKQVSAIVYNHFK